MLVKKLFKKCWRKCEKPRFFYQNNNFLYLLIAWGIGAKMLSAVATDADRIQNTLWLSSSNQSVAGGALIGIIIGLVLRCFLFPIFYLIFAFNVLNGRKKLLAHINEQESLLANLQNA